jgi:very-short-patch-repair endonuclease
VHVVVPDDSSARSRGYAIVRRSVAPLRLVATERVRYVDCATAAISAARQMHDSRRVLACLSEALQRGLTTYDSLVCAHVQGSPRNSRRTGDAIEALGAGVRSAPEADFRRLVMTSPLLSDAEFNVWLRLQSGRVICVDALIPSSAVIHETNGRQAHAREDLFEDMQERHDALTASGFTVLHNPPSRIRGRRREVLAQVERCHQLYDGRGLPPGVQRIAGAA